MWVAGDSLVALEIGGVLVFVPASILIEAGLSLVMTSDLHAATGRQHEI
jgi:hypothetical protein